MIFIFNLNFAQYFLHLYMQMAGFIGRLTSPGTLTAAVVGGAALTGAYYYRRGTLQAGASPGQFVI